MLGRLTMIYDCILDIAHKKLPVYVIISLEDYKLNDMQMDEYIDVKDSQTETCRAWNNYHNMPG